MGENAVLISTGTTIRVENTLSNSLLPDGIEVKNTIKWHIAHGLTGSRPVLARCTRQVPWFSFIYFVQKMWGK
jgi:hypothetical protein